MSNDANAQVIVTPHATDADRAAAYFFKEIDGELTLLVEGDIPSVDVPRNVAHWTKLGWTIRDVRA